MAQWLRLLTPNAGGLGSIPGQGTRSHVSQQKILCVTTKTGAAKERKKENSKISIIQIQTTSQSDNED